MRRFLFALLACLFVTLPVQATETLTYSGYSSWAKNFTVWIVPHRVGTMTVRAQWAPTSKGKYTFELRHQIIPGDYSTTDYWCFIGSEFAGSPPAGDWTCSFDNAPMGGEWQTSLWPYSGGKMFVSLTVTAETD